MQYSETTWQLRIPSVYHKLMEKISSSTCGEDEQAISLAMNNALNERALDASRKVMGIILSSAST